MPIAGVIISVAMLAVPGYASDLWIDQLVACRRFLAFPDLPCWRKCPPKNSTSSPKKVVWLRSVALLPATHHHPFDGGREQSCSIRIKEGTCLPRQEIYRSYNCIVLIVELTSVLLTMASESQPYERFS
uniref:Putative secreted protein n=1 Tax=Anopheles darlingi TaxID=43151 RepID=A0A2M4DMM7_ANODA